MKNSCSLNITCFLIFILLVSVSRLFGQPNPLPESSKSVNNDSRRWLWGNNPKVSISQIKLTGGPDEEDERFMFFHPRDIVVDRPGNIYVLDAGNYRILKYDHDWNYIKTIGKKGQGPGEFISGLSMDINHEGYIYLTDEANFRIQVFSPEGIHHKTIRLKNPEGFIRLYSNNSYVIAGRTDYKIMFWKQQYKNKDIKGLKFIDVFDGTVKPVRSFGFFRDMGHMRNMPGSDFYYTIDKDNNIYLTYKNQNRIEK